MVKKIFYYLLLSFVLFVIVYTQIIQASYDTIDADDLVELFRYKDDFVYYYFTYVYHGRFVTSTLVALIGAILPLSLDIHPICWIQTFGVGLKAIFIFITCYLLSSSMFIFDKKNSNYKKFCMCLVILFLYFLYQNRMVCNNNADMLYTAFYGFQFPFIIYFFFWKSFIKYFCDEKDNNKQIITFCLISFLIGFSSEFFSFTTFCVLTLLFIGLTINYLFKKSKNISVYVYTYICSCMGFLLYVFNPGFIDTMSGKESNFFSFLDNFKDWFLEVIKSLKQTLFNDFIYIFLIIIILFIILFFLKIQNKRKKILILILYILSVIGFYLSMSFVRFGNDHLYICHFDVIMQVQIALIFAIILQISFLSEYKYLRNIIISIICCCLLYATKGNFVDVYKLIIKNDKDNYISRYSDNNIDTILNRYKSEYILLEDIKNGKEIYNLNKKELNPNNYLCHHYVETIYNLNYDINPQQLNIESVEQLYEKFLTEGGKVLPEEELNRHNFNVLLRKYKRNK